MQERIRHEHQTPMFLHGFSVAPALLVQAQRRCTVLIKGFNGPAWQRQGDDPLGTPVQSVRHQHDRGACQLRALEADHQADFAEPGAAHGQRKGPIGLIPYGHGPVRGERDERDQVFHRNRGPRQPDGFPRRSLEDKAVGLQIPGLFQQAEPVFVAVSGHGHELGGKRPTIEHEYTEWDFAPYRGLQQVNAKIALGATLPVQRLKVWVCSQEGIAFLMEARPFLAFGRDGTVRKMLVDERFPARARFIASRQSEGHRKTDGATDIRTGDRIVRERRSILPMIVMAIDLVEQTAHMRAQRVIQPQERVRLWTADRFRLLEQIRDATVIDTVLEPGGFREEAGEVGVVSTLQHTAGDIGQAFIPTTSL